MTPSGGTAGDDFSRHVDEEDGQQWEDYTCQGTFEDLIRSVELVLREWRACGTDLVPSNEATASGSPPAPSYSRTLEHDGQLFSIQLVPPPDQMLPSATTTNNNNNNARAPASTPTPPRAAPATAALPENGTASEACELGNRHLDFASGSEALGAAIVTPLHRWFGLKQYVLLRALGEGGQAGMGVDQLLWTTTVAAGNCQCSVPVLVSCDWDGLVDEHGPAGGGGVQSGASCKGYSAPGSKGVACSVRFQTAWTEKPPPELLYLDGLTDLFLSKIRDAHCLPGRAFAPIVSTTAQQSWEWTKPEGAETPMPAPALPWERVVGGSGAQEKDASAVAAAAAAAAAAATLGERHHGGGGGNSATTSGSPFLDPSMATGSNIAVAAAAAAAAVAGERGAARGVLGARQDAVRKLLRAIGGGSEEDEAEEESRMVPLWGPDEDPFVSLSVRVRWTELREGLVEESQHYTTLDPLPEEVRGGAINSSGSGAQWFVSPRWRQSPGETAADAGSANGDANNSAHQRRQGQGRGQGQGGGRLGDACCRLLGALVLTTAMHPGTLMADLGAGPLQDGPAALAEDYGKAASATLSAETRAAVEVLCSKAQSPSIDHDEIDLILRHLLHPPPEEQGRQEAGGPDNAGSVTGEGQQPPPPASLSSPSSSSSTWRTVYPGRAAQEGRRTSSEWTQVYPRPDGEEVDGSAPETGDLRQRPQGTADADGAATAAAAASSLLKVGAPGGEGSRAWGPWKLSAAGGSGAGDERTREERSLWVWAERGGVPIGRLLSLLSLRVASCEDLSSMSLLWMSFVRDVRLLWEDGAALARMGPIPEVDGTSMFDRSAGCTGQDRSVASQLRGNRQAFAGGGGGDGAKSGGRLPWRSQGRPDRPLALYPDTRMCLIWQKLQMLNCCRAGVAARVEMKPSPLLSSPPPGSGGGGGGDDAAAAEEEEEEEDNEDEHFYDTQEYYQTSEDEDGEVGGGGSGNGRPEGVVAGGAHQLGVCGLTLGSASGEGGIELIGAATAGGGAVAEGDAAAEADDDGREDHHKGGDCDAPEDSADASEGDVRQQQPQQQEGEVSSAPAPREEDSSIAATKTAAQASAATDGAPVEVHRIEASEPETETEPPAAGEAAVETEPPATPSADAPSPATETPAERTDVEESPRSAPASTGTIDEQAAGPVRAPTPGEALEEEHADCPSEQTARKEAEERTRTAAAPRGEELPPTSSLMLHEHTPAAVEATRDTDGDGGGGFGPVPSDKAPPSSPAGLAQKPPLKGVEISGPVAIAGASAAEKNVPPVPVAPESDSSSSGGRPTEEEEQHPDPASVNNTPAATEAGTPDGAPLPPPMGRLLCTGAAVRHPRLQDNGPVTSDMLDQQALGHASTYRGREVLLDDMKAFRLENDGGGGGAVFADFVRWYQPECWQSAATPEAWVGPSEDRVGGAKEDDKRLAWPGQGQILWKSSLASHPHPHPRSEDPRAASTSPPFLDSRGPPAPPSVVTLAGWLSCWGDAGAAVEEGEGRAVRPAPLFRDDKEGEKALHFLETISPGALLVQLLSGLLGLSVFVLEEACSGSSSLPGVQASVEAARRKVIEAVELLADASTSTSTLTSTTQVGESSSTSAAWGEGGANDAVSVGSSSSSGGGGGGSVGDGGGRGSGDGNFGPAKNSAEVSSLSPFRVALLSVDGACVAVTKAERALAMAVSLQRSMPGQKDLVNAMVAACNEARGGAGEARVSARAQKEFLRDLLLAQGIQRTPGSELEDLLASYDEEHRQDGVKDGSGVDVGGGGGGGGGSGVMPPPRTKEYVLRCQTPAPFCSRNIGRGQMDAYPTPPSRMYAKTDGKNLRVALSLCESEI